MYEQACCVRYDLHLKQGVIPISFNNVSTRMRLYIQTNYNPYDIIIHNLFICKLEQVEDNVVYAVALRLLNPIMLVHAWEAIILERKILVVR